MNSINFLRTASPHAALVNALMRVSILCAQNGVASAQGLRIIRRKYPKLWTKLIINWDESTHSQLIDILQREVQPQLLRLAKAGRQKPEHFLLDTNILANMLPAQHTQPIGIEITPDLHFVRTQRRYNKRRYARVRATSRPSFWSGMTLSTLVTAAFWGASIQELDWVSTTPILTDVNTILIALYVILGLRLFRLYQSTSKPRNREQNKRKRGWKHTLSTRAGQHIRW